MRASSSGSSALWSRLRGIANVWSWTALTRTALESPTFEQKILVPTIKTETHVLPLKRKLMPELRSKDVATAENDLASDSLTSVESTTLYWLFAKSNILLIPCSTLLAKFYFTKSETSLPKTPWPSQTAKKWVLLYSPRCGITRYWS